MIASTSTRMDTAVARLREATGVSLAFGGTVGASRKLSLAHFCGRSVGALDGVTGVTVDLATGRVDVESAAPVPADALAAAVDEAGYEIAPS